MTPRQRRRRIYRPDQGGICRAYADLRDYRDVGGRREALIPPGQKPVLPSPPTVRSNGQHLRDSSFGKIRASGTQTGTA
jgi:hypothetical protein